ncbi:MAG: hypothetical protein ACI8S6_000194, partial [Myxococcota bacterium]
RQILFALTATTLGLLLALGGAELAARQLTAPRVQQVPLAGTARLIDGVPVWRAPTGAAERENRACEGEAVLLFGSSIFFGSSLPPEDTLGPPIQAALPGTCVENHAQPGFTFANEHAIARERLAEPGARPPAVVVWEIWQNSINTLDVIGDSAYNFGELAVDAGGVPSVLALSPPANRALFARSAVFRQLTLRAASLRPPTQLMPRWEAFAAGPLTDAIAEAEAAGATVILALLPALDRPFSESASAGYVGYEPVRRLAVSAGLPLVDVAEQLAGQPVEALRLDTCCHYNADGQKALAEVLAPFIGSALR